jgi:hypothetical protein
VASDSLKALMNDVFASNEVDISQHIDDLQAIAEGKPLAVSCQRQKRIHRSRQPRSHEADPDRRPTAIGKRQRKVDANMVSIAAADASMSIEADRRHQMEGTDR